MGKIDHDKLQKELFNRIEGYATNVRKLYLSAFTEIINIVKGTELNDDIPFSFADYGYTNDVQPILRHLYSQVYQTIRGGIQAEWLNSNKHNDELVKAVFGAQSIQDNHFAKYFKRNQTAMDAFFTRKSADGGLNLSQRVWKYTGRFKEELESSLDLAIGEGTPALRLASKVQQYLNEPDRYYRRFRYKAGEDENGNPIYGRKWKRRVFDKTTGLYSWVDADPSKYNPGKGMYRSSARNAQRLTRTEINMAYRTADYDRWQQLDFVIGVEIKLSNNHPVTDICDELQGKYPKDFKWTGWHPQCRCYMVPVLASQDEVDKMTENILDGKEASDGVRCSEEVKDVPQAFKDWITDNKERIEKAKERGTLPYFIKDNPKVFEIFQVESLGLIPIESLSQYAESSWDENLVNMVVKRFEKANPEYFTHGFGKISVNKCILGYVFDGTIMETERNPIGADLIRINDGKLIGSRKFNPAQDLMSALKAIAKDGEKVSLTFNQEYSLESLWHEILHCKSKQWGSCLTTEQTNAMEIINQFCARKSYTEFIEAIGGKASHAMNVLKEGYGYKEKLEKFQLLLSEYKIPVNKAYNHFKNIIVETPYDEIFDRIADFVSTEGAISVRDAEVLVDKMCGNTSVHTFAKLKKRI